MLATALGALLAAGCGAAESSGNQVRFQVSGPASSRATAGCFLLLNARVVGDGRMRYCLKRFRGGPGPGAIVRDSGTLTVVLPEGTMRAAVRIVQRFAADGRHARQTLHGTLLGGSGGFANAHGSIEGGGTDDEHPPGQIVASDLRYVATLRP